jgi:hypothetical protein
LRQRLPAKPLLNLTQQNAVVHHDGVFVYAIYLTAGLREYRLDELAN